MEFGPRRVLALLCAVQLLVYIDRGEKGHLADRSTLMSKPYQTANKIADDHLSLHTTVTSEQRLAGQQKDAGLRPTCPSERASFLLVQASYLPTG